MDGCDSTAVQAFAGRFLDDVSGGMTSVLCALGDRLGLFRALAEGGPASSAELAARAGLDERHVREWLLGLLSAGYLDARRQAAEEPVFSLPPEHAAVLAHDDSPFFLGGAAGLVPRSPRCWSPSPRRSARAAASRRRRTPRASTGRCGG